MSVVAVLLDIVRTCPIHVPETIRTCEFVHWFVVQVLAEFTRVVLVALVAVPVAIASSLAVRTILPSVPHVAGSHVVLREVTTHVSGSYDLNIPAAVVPAFIIKNLPLSIANVSVFTIAHDSAGVNCRVFVPPGFIITHVTFTSFPTWLPERKRIVAQFASHVMAVAVVTVDVLPPLAVRVLLQRLLAPQAQAPNVPARERDGI